MDNRIILSRYVVIPPLADVLLIFLEYLWALLVILNGNSVYNANALRNYQLLPMCTIVTVALLGLNVLFGRIRIQRRNLTVAVVLCVYAVIYFWVQWDRMAMLNYVYLFIAGLPCLYLLFAEMHREGRLMILMNRLVNVVIVLCLMSLFFWTFGTVLGWIKTNMNTRISWGWLRRVKGYWGLHFNIQWETTFGARIYRNTGIFTEAPMLSLWCNIALAFTALLKRNLSKFKTAVLIVTIITTMSTTGLIFIVLCFGLRYFSQFRQMKFLAKAALIVSSLALIPAAIYYVNSLLVTKSDTVSFAMRMSDYVAGILLWLDYPIFGSGFAGLAALQQYIYSPNGAFGFSNSVMAVLSTGGIWMALVYYVPHVVMAIPSATRSKALACFGICYLYLFITTAFFARYIAVVMIAFELALLMERENNDQIGMELQFEESYG